MLKSETKDAKDKVEKWMACPVVATDYPGLAYLCTLNELLVVERVDALHEVISKTRRVGYTIYNNAGEKVFLAVKELQKQERFTIKVFNNYGNEIIQVKKPTKLFFNNVLVWAPPGNFVGSVEQDKCWSQNYVMKNRSGEPILKLKAQKVFKFVYDIMSGEEKIGTIMSKWEISNVNEYKFGVTFPITMSVEEKSVLLGACFLMDCLKCNKCC
ncbi:phospholipid scramblase 2-like [Pectinophora gossypiella]|uniref:phospholipid scramblase 2-like n=1 Tax=Pectinophora gossypiella TaxID=13191 RepID=UPI00214F33DB|nr:phospholipid scramblase 2-like [Pectinophora gossypiella]